MFGADRQATRRQVTAALEAGFHQAGLEFRLVVERDDTHMSGIHNSEYLATKNKQGWRILVASVSGDQSGKAMLTAGAE